MLSGRAPAHASHARAPPHRTRAPTWRLTLQAGDLIAIAPTDYYYDQGERLKIVSISCADTTSGSCSSGGGGSAGGSFGSSGNGGSSGRLNSTAAGSSWRLQLSRPLGFNHNGQRYSVLHQGSGRTMVLDARAEVAVLTRWAGKR